MMLAAKREDEIAGVVLGHVDGDGLGTVDHLAVTAAVRGEGLGRGLLSALWVQTPRVDQTLTERVRGRDGVYAQWVMDKDLTLNSPAGLSPGQRDL